MNETIALLLPTVTGATNDVQPLDVPSWLEDFCQDPKWANLTADSAFQQESSRAAVLGFTPCFESIVIMSPVYVIAIVLGVVRLVQLMRFRAQHSQVVGGLLEPNVHLLRLACAFIAFAQPIVVMVYLQYQPEFAAARQFFFFFSFFFRFRFFCIQQLSSLLATLLAVPCGLWPCL